MYKCISCPRNTVFDPEKHFLPKDFRKVRKSWQIWISRQNSVCKIYIWVLVWVRTIRRRPFAFAQRLPSCDTAHSSVVVFERQAMIRVLPPQLLFFWASCWYYWFNRFVLSLPGVTSANTCSSCYMCKLFFEETCTESPRTDHRDTWALASCPTLCTDLWLSREQRNIA